MLQYLILFFMNFALVGIFQRLAIQSNILIDQPNHRSNHADETVRGAGAIFVISTLISWFFVFNQTHESYVPYLMVGSGMIAAVSFLDDLIGLRIRTRLAAQIAGSLIFLSAIPIPSFLQYMAGDFAVLWIPLAAFFMVSVVNIYNFMDGSDGLAALHSLCVLIGWVLFTLSTGSLHTQGLICMPLIFALLAFLVHNWSPARVFMGDVGSTFLGFTFAALGVIQVPGILRSSNFFTLLLLMMPFLLDASHTLILRLIRGEKWYLPHNQHLFQRLVRAGYSHPVVAVTYGLITVYMGICAILISNEIVTNYVGVGAILVAPYAVLLTWVHVVEESSVIRQQPSGESPLQSLR